MTFSRRVYQVRKTKLQASLAFLKRLFSCIQEGRLPVVAAFHIKRLLNPNIFNPSNHIAIETASVCSNKCTYCSMYYLGKKDMGVMSLDNFRKFIDLNAAYLKKNRIGVYLQHRGETLLNKNLLAMVKYASEQGVSINQLHTSLSVHFDFKGLMESAIPSILVNIGGTTKEVHEKVMRGSDFELLKKNLSECCRLNKYNKPIFLKMNVTKDNIHQVKELPEFFKSLGGNPENVLIWNTSFWIPATLSKEERKIFLGNVASEEVKDYLNFTYDQDANIEAKVKACRYLGTAVRWDGKISACCQDKYGFFNLGNAFDTPLQEILSTKEYKTAVEKGKRMEHEICKDCN